MAYTAQSPDARRRSVLGTVALAAATISAIAFAALLVGALAGMEGFQEGESATLLGTVLWFTFMIGAIVALVFGAVAFLGGRAKGRAGDQRAGLLALGWCVIAVLAVVLISVLAA